MVAAAEAEADVEGAAAAATRRRLVGGEKGEVRSGKGQRHSFPLEAERGLRKGSVGCFIIPLEET